MKGRTTFSIAKQMMKTLSALMLTLLIAGPAFSQAPNCDCNSGYSWVNTNPQSEEYYTLTKDGKFVYATASDITNPYAVADKKFIDLSYYDLDKTADSNNKMFIQYNGSGKFNIWICLPDTSSIATGSAAYIEYEEGLDAADEDASHKQLKSASPWTSEPRYDLEYSSATNDNHINNVIKVDKGGDNEPVIIGTADFEDIID